MISLGEAPNGAMISAPHLRRFLISCCCYHLNMKAPPLRRFKFLISCCCCYLNMKSFLVIALVAITSAQILSSSYAAALVIPYGGVAEAFVIPYGGV